MGASLRLEFKPRFEDLWKELGAAKAILAGLVGVGAGDEPTRLQADGRSKLHRTELRAMLESATRYHRDVAPGRWVIEGKRGRERWEVIVEPDEALELLVVVTAYPV
jgi:hypothetical protein